ncbi:hypothetical protein ACSQ67_017853 [Phaseolus vulgaris]
MGAGREVSISLDGVRDKNLMQLKKLNLALFPVRYNDKYYADALASGEFTKLGFLKLLHLSSCSLKQLSLLQMLRYAKKGWVYKGHVECVYHLPKIDCFAFAFQLTIVIFVLEQLRAGWKRRKEGASSGLHHDIRRFSTLPWTWYWCKFCDVNLGVYAGTKLLNHALDLCSKQNISEVYLHVQTNNEDAINFYKKFGFEITETIQNYYTNITPPDCYVLTRYTVPSTTKK